MKSILSLSVLLSSVSAFAFPTVGDQATYNMIQDSQVATLVTSVSAMDVENDQLTLTGTVSVQGKVIQTSSSQQDMRMLTTDYSNPAICAQTSNAVVESVTVPKGTFQACHMTQKFDNGGQSDLWLATVPFAIVKQTIRQNGSVTSIELSDLFLK